MHRFRIGLTLLLLPCLAHIASAAEPNALSAEELDEGWILLFDGETLFGWKDGGSADWKVAGGAIVVTEGEKGLLHTTSEFADFDLKLQFRCQSDTNSGIFVRTPAQPKAAGEDCYEINIASPPHPFALGAIVDRKTGSSAKITGEWQSMRIHVRNNRVSVSVDDMLVCGYTDEDPLARGYIGLQHNEGKIEFRDIKLKPLSLEPLIGTSLEGWNTDRAEESEFTVSDQGVLNIDGGKGQIETEGEYGDFVLQTEIYVGGDNLNSGIFFRCIPGDFWMGYESQIHNGYKNGDRTQPVDAGTGGIFRRQNARRVVADDHEWFHKTIVATGPHLAVWVEGIQVSDWTDERPPHENPRKGKRLEAGTIILQGHDPGTDISFRDMRISEMPDRQE